MFRLMFGRTVDTLTLERNARTTPEMIDRFYAAPLQGEMNVGELQSKRRPRPWEQAITVGQCPTNSQKMHQPNFSTNIEGVFFAIVRSCRWAALDDSFSTFVHATWTVVDCNS